jgi:zinc and cadmium transporter
MPEFAVILIGGFLMAAIAMLGGLSTWMAPATLDRLLLPLVALAAGSLLGGAFFHMIPEGIAGLPPVFAFGWVVLGFSVFLALEQFLNWHHSHRAGTLEQEPFTWLILLGDALHNFLGGIGIAGTFLIDPRAGIIAWLAAAAHEVPQELGDFGALVHGGWERRRALLWNLISALTFPLGAMLAWALAGAVDLRVLVLFGAGNFIYVAASDLIPEIKAGGDRATGLLHFLCFGAGLALLYGIALAFGSGP